MLNNTTCYSQNNVSNPCSSDDCNRGNHVSFHASVNLSAAAIIAVLSPVAVIANGLILATMWSKNFMRTSFHVFLSALAFTDLFTGLVAQPFYAAGGVMNSTAVHDAPIRVAQTISTIGDCTSTFFVTITILIITMMAIERWLYMARRSFLTPRRRYFTVISLLLMPIPAIVMLVFANYKDPAYEYIYTMTIITEVSVCYVITIFSYFKVYRIIRRHQHQVQVSWISQNSGQSAIEVEKYKKSVATMFYILLIFGVCFIPFIVVSPLTLTPDSRIAKTFVSAQRVTMVLVFLSSSVNPGLYLWRMRDIRNGLRQLLARSS